MRNILVDAGPIIALFDKNDKYHEGALTFVKGYSGFLWTTWPVVTEASHMLDFSIKSQLALLEWIQRGGIRIYDVGENHIERIVQLSKKFKDVPMDLADATLIAVSEISGFKEIATIDTDFYIYRDIRNQYLTNVFL